MIADGSAPAGDLALAVSLGAAASAATLFGGYLALRVDRLGTLVSGLAAGMVLGIALGDLLPEAIQLGRDHLSPRVIGVSLLAGFCFYVLIGAGTRVGSFGGGSWRSHLPPALLTVHSFLDGLGIGLAFQIDARAGWLVAIAVLAHDIADGINIVGLSLVSHDRATARRWLLANCAAPLTGALAGSILSLNPPALAPVIALYAGMFLYIGASDLLPHLFTVDGRWRSRLVVVAGAALMTVIVGLA